MALRIIRVPWAKGGKCTITAFELGIPEISTLLTPFQEHLSSRVTTRYVMYIVYKIMVLDLHNKQITRESGLGFRVSTSLLIQYPYKTLLLCLLSAGLPQCWVVIRNRNIPKWFCQGGSEGSFSKNQRTSSFIQSKKFSLR